MLLLGGFTLAAALSKQNIDKVRLSGLPRCEALAHLPQSHTGTRDQGSLFRRNSSPISTLRLHVRGLFRKHVDQ